MSYSELLTFKCDICRAERPDEKISVFKVDLTPSGKNLPPWTITRNLKYCNDNPACMEGVRKWEPS